MSNLLETPLNEVRSTEVLNLITELEQACQISSAPFLRMTLWHFLVQCVYPNGSATKREPINLKFLPLSDCNLERTLSKLLKQPNGDLYSLCEELARRRGESIEFSLGKKLVTFLNAMLPKYPASKKPSARQQRRDSVVRQRRWNRG